ncbi:N-acetyllactosaminide beta-1,3-N-acetylglucosaminyltransferase 2 [Betta splendens]|uniref:Hexosyltransferase n=1 Tax=Betta splendens TaxID=158456 RepID=A0A6P7NUA7_BETSP|nr:N-acetyllactosaminide beta-1,3-N-acetylglucosaminyltransferase 2 [Betta splendens]XP_029021104.1 N-acetyllactosaminide beta-1,3-N-acetylglucosaminyltransferase 2 [Betta splendens]
MARLCCCCCCCCLRRRRLRNVLICLCSPCICLALFVVYVGVVVYIRTQQFISSGALMEGSVHIIHFVAPGSLRNANFAPLPQSFWTLDPAQGAIWNHLQLPIDRYFSPILHPKQHKQPDSDSSEVLLKQSFSAVTNTDSLRKNFKQFPQQIQDFVNHMDKRDYPNLIQPDGVCGAGASDETGPPLLLLAIKTTELNFRNRQAIRQTWGRAGWVAGHRSSSGGYVRRVFLLGKGNPQDQGVDSSELLELESKHYGDILQWDFRDTFFNLTLKDIHFWRWFSLHCGQTQFVFKGDDDVFVNTPKMLSYLQDQLRKPDANKVMENFMVGDVIGAAMPSRANMSKYFIPDTFFKGLYPAYAGGGGVVYSGPLTKRLHDVSQRVHLFPIDDVYVGMLMVRLNTSPVHHPAFLTFGFSEKEEKEPCSYHTILLVHKRSPSQVLRLWDDMRKTRDQCRNVTLRKDTQVVTQKLV